MADTQNDNSSYPAIGQLALKHGLATQEAIELAWKTSSKAPEPFTAFADYLVEKELISPLDMQRLMTASRVVEIRKNEVKFGTIAVEKGYLSISLLKLALDEQKQEMLHKKRTKLLGDILVEAGMITTGQRKDVLKEQDRLKALNQTASELTAPALSTPSPQAANHPSKPATENQYLTTDFPLERGITLTVDREAFDALISKTADFDRTITPREIKDTLARHKIIFGLIDETKIDNFIKSKGSDAPPLRVACGIKPERGTDAAVKYHFKTDRLEIGKVDRRGKMDFRQRGEIPRVAVNDILAEKTPPTKGINGTNVFGETITVSPSLDVKMQPDKGAKLSKDGLKILACIDGEPRLNLSGTIGVLDEFITDMVDYETGHIEYPGNVRVKGCIHNGFKVTGKDINTGEIDGGIIHADGNLFVAKGITHAVIYSMGNVSAKFIQNSTILCLGDIYTDKEIVDSTIETSGACLIDHGTIISSKITAKMGIYTRNTGTELSIPSLLKVGEDIFVIRETARFEQEKAQIRKKLVTAGKKKSKLEITLKAEQEKSSKLASMEESSMAMQKRTILGIASLNQAGSKPDTQEKLQRMEDQLQTLKKKGDSVQVALNQSIEKAEQTARELKELSEEIAAHEQQVQNLIQELKNLKKLTAKIPGVTCVDVSKTLMAGTKIMGPHSQLIIKKDHKKVKIIEIQSPSSDKEQAQSRWELQITPG
jgi:uncharacterized protein (DUF342 family)